MVILLVKTLSGIFREKFKINVYKSLKSGFITFYSEELLYLQDYRLIVVGSTMNKTH